MCEGPEFSPGGSLIHRYGARRVPFAPQPPDAALGSAIGAHLRRHLGQSAMVLHECESDLIHVDVHVLGPTRARPHLTLVTAGMSQAPMYIPADNGGEVLGYAELMITLPPQWPISRRTLRRPKHGWPVTWLRLLARLPHEYDTWLGYGHTVPNGDPPAPFSRSTDLCGMLVMPPESVPEEFLTLPLAPHRVIEFFALIPLHRDEIDMKLERGLDALLERLDAHSVGDVVDPDRASVVE
jgi:hypothetical protein